MLFISWYSVRTRTCLYYRLLAVNLLTTIKSGVLVFVFPQKSFSLRYLLSHPTLPDLSRR